MAGDSVSEANICENAKQFLEELGAEAPCTSTVLFLYLYFLFCLIFLGRAVA